MNIFDIFESKRAVKQLPANFKPKNISPVLNGPYGKKNATQGYLVGESEITEASMSREDAIEKLGRLRGIGKKIETGRDTYEGNLANEYVSDVYDVYSWMDANLGIGGMNDPKLKQILEPVMKLRGAAKKLETKPGSGSNARFGNLIVNTLYPLIVYIRDVMELSEGYYHLPDYDREKYQARSGLEGPIQTRSGKVVYYDPNEGSYYDPDTDFYISFDDFQALDEGLGGTIGKYALAAMLGLGTLKGLDSTSAKHTPLGQALNHAAENWSGEEAAEALKLYRNIDALVDRNPSDLRYWASQNQDLVSQFKESKIQNESIDAIKQIVADKGAAKINGVLVDMFTASAIAQIYDAVNDKNKTAIEKMLTTPQGLSKIADFAMKQLKEDEWSRDTRETLEQNPMINAVINRIVMQKRDLLSKYGPDVVMNAVEDVVGDEEFEEIGSSDVSIYVRYVEDYLKNYSRINEKFDMEPTPKSKRGMYKGRTADQLRKQYNAIKKKENKSKADIEKMRELAFAVRAKTGWGKVNENKATYEDVLSDLQKKLGDYLQDVATAVKKDPDLLDKSDAPSAELAAPVKTITTDDGHEIKIHGNEDDGFRITINNRSMKSKFKDLSEAEMASEMYCSRRRNESRDYISEV